MPDETTLETLGNRPTRVYVVNADSITGGGGGTGGTTTVNVPTAANSPGSVRLSDGSAFYRATTPADTQPISGTVELGSDSLAALEMSTVSVNNFPANQTVNGVVNLGGDTLAALETTSIANFPATQQVSGTVNVGNLPETQTVMGSVSVSNFPASQQVTGMVSLSADNLAALDSVSVNNFPATQQIAGTVSVNNYPATQQIAGTVDLGAASLTALETINIGNFPATQDVNVLNFPATQTVSGTVTANLGTLNGAATAANQTAGNTNLTTIATGTGAPADVEAGDGVGSFSTIALLKRIRTRLTDLISAVNGPVQTSQRFTATAATTTQNFVPTLSGTDFTYTQIILWLRITTGGGTGVSMRVQGASMQDTSNFITLNGTAANVTTVGTYTYGYGFRNTNTLGMSQAVGGVLPKNFRIQVFHNDTTALTYTVDIQYFQ